MNKIKDHAFAVLAAFLVGLPGVHAAIGPFVQQAYLKPAAIGSTQEGDWFGNAVAVLGDTVVIGAPLEDSSTTGVNSTPNENADTAGAAYVFVRSAGGWTQQAYLKPATNLAGDYFGYSVAISGDTLVVGSLSSAFVFVRNGTNWTQQARLRATSVGTTQAGDLFGWSVSISGETVIVGAPYEDSSTRGVNSAPNESASEAGAAYIFVRTGTNWTQQAYLKPAAVGTTQVSDYFGISVAVSGDMVIVGAPFESSTTTGVNSTPNEGTFASGAAYVFTRSGTNWTQQAYLKPAAVGTTQAGDQFGRSVAASGDTVVVGALYESSSTSGVNSTPNESASEAGAVYVFARTGTNWTQQAYLKSTIGGLTSTRDWFGASVGVSGDTLVVGANGEDRAAGTAYVFLRNGTNWAQQTSLKPTTSGTWREDDEFGWSVGVSGNTIVVAANREDSNSTGVNSAPNESGFNFNSGAAYVFAFVLACPDDLVVANTPGQCYATNVVFSVPDAGGAPVTCQLNNTVITSPWSFNVGTNVITCTVSNFTSVDICTFNVIVRDTEAPVFSSCPANQMLVVSPLSNSVTAIFSPVAQDNCGTTGLVIACVPPSGSAFSLGTNNVVCTATDAAGNFAVCRFQVVVLGARGLKQGVLAELIALRAGVTDKQDGQRLDQAIEHLTRSLDADLWVDQTHLELKQGERAFKEEKETVKHLFDALKRESTTLSAVVIQDLIERIVRADQLLAAVAIAEAEVAGDANRISAAQREFARGEAETAEGNPDKAIEHYAHAWRDTTHSKITNFVRAPDGRSQLQFLGEPLQKYAIQCSTDLKTWTTLDTRTADTDGIIEYDDAGAGKLPARFYRIATP